MLLHESLETRIDATESRSVSLDRKHLSVKEVSEVRLIVSQAPDGRPDLRRSEDRTKDVTLVAAGRSMPMPCQT